MATLSIRMTDKELSMLKDYAKVNRSSVSEIVRDTIMERIEDEFDMKVFTEYKTEQNAGTLEIYSHEEAWTEIES